MSDTLPTDQDQVIRAQEIIRKLTEALSGAVELIDELRGYTENWDWKYGERWDHEEQAIRSAITRKGD